MNGWHRHRHRPGPELPVDTANEGWGLLTGHQRGPRPGHTRGLSHGHGLCQWPPDRNPSRPSLRDTSAELTLRLLSCCYQAKRRAAWTRLSASWRGPIPYRRKVPQPIRTRADPGRQSGTVTCGDGRRGTGCLLMACKRPGVRVPLAPQVRDINRKLEQRVQQKSTATAVCDPAVHQFGCGQSNSSRCWHDRTFRQLQRPVTCRNLPFSPDGPCLPAPGAPR